MFPAPDWPLEDVATRNIFLRDLQRFFFLFFWFPILFQNLRSELVYTFKWTKSIARLWRNQICERKKKKSNYLLTHRWNGGSGAGNEHIFKGGLKCFFNFLLHWNVSLAMWSLNFQIQILYWYSKNYPIRSSFTLTQSSR